MYGAGNSKRERKKWKKKENKKSRKLGYQQRAVLGRIINPGTFRYTLQT